MDLLRSRQKCQFSILLLKPARESTLQLQAITFIFYYCDISVCNLYRNFPRMCNTMGAALQQEFQAYSLYEPVQFCLESNLFWLRFFCFIFRYYIPDCFFYFRNVFTGLHMSIYLNYIYSVSSEFRNLLERCVVLSFFLFSHGDG